MVQRKKEKLDDEIMEKVGSLMINLSDKVYDMQKQHEYNFLTLVGFIIAANAIIITSDTVSQSVKTILIISIICLSIGLFLSNNLTGAQIIKYFRGVSELSKTDTENTFQSLEKAENHFKTKTVDIVFTAISSLALNGGFVLFIIGLIKFL